MSQATFSWKNLRILILLLILFIVAVNAWRDKQQNWQAPVFVALYPLNADGSVETQQYIQQLSTQDYQEIADYLQQQAQSYQKNIHIYFKLGQQVEQLAPKVPESSSVFDAIVWSLKFRYYAWQQKQDLGIQPQLSLFLNYYDPQRYKMLKHSTALQNGRIGVVNVFASDKQNAQNNIVIAHEMLHAFGASDKYDLSTGQPIYPQGYGNPLQQPRYPQMTAELMGGQRVLTATSYKMPNSLGQVVIGEATALEIGW